MFIHKNKVLLIYQAIIFATKKKKITKLTAERNISHQIIA